MFQHSEYPPVYVRLAGFKAMIGLSEILIHCYIFADIGRGNKAGLSICFVVVSLANWLSAVLIGFWPSVVCCPPTESLNYSAMLLIPSNSLRSPSSSMSHW